MRSLYPEIEPFEHGMLEAGDGNSLYWETCGNPNGKPALVLHGGPGSGCTPGMRRFFDPAAYRVVLFDQRIAGRSARSAADFETDLAANTTPHLLADIERLRTHLGIDRWLVWGISWGVTLALAYAEQHPHRVTELILGSVTNTRPAEIQWLYRGVGRFYPEAFERFRAGAPESECDGDLVAAYNRLLNGSDLAARVHAARHWCDWENAMAPHPRYESARFRMAFARIAAHYFAHNAWLEDRQLLRNAHRLTGIAGVMVHGRMDVGSPLGTAWELGKAWPDAELVVVEGAGHSVSQPSMTEHLLDAADRFART